MLVSPATSVMEVLEKPLVAKRTVAVSIIADFLIFLPFPDHRREIKLTD